jgi:hypothetical protein
MNNCRDCQPPASTTACHAPAALPRLHHQHRPSPRPQPKASGETRYPIEGDTDDAAHLLPRKLPPKLTTPLTTSKVAHRAGPGMPHRRHGGREHPRAKSPHPTAHYNPPEGRSHRRALPPFVSAGGSTRSALQQPRYDRPGHGSIAGTDKDATRSWEPTKLSTAGRSLGEEENGLPPPSSCSCTPAARRSGDGEQERRWGGWWHRAARVPPESPERDDARVRDFPRASLLKFYIFRIRKLIAPPTPNA